MKTWKIDTGCILVEIDTQWNVNIRNNMYVAKSISVEIDTQWNVNISEADIKNAIKKVEIDTQWNVNFRIPQELYTHV